MNVFSVIKENRARNAVQLHQSSKIPSIFIIAPSRTTLVLHSMEVYSFKAVTLLTIYYIINAENDTQVGWHVVIADYICMDKYCPQFCIGGSWGIFIKGDDANGGSVVNITRCVIQNNSIRISKDIMTENWYYGAGMYVERRQA